MIAREAAAIAGASYYGVLQPESLLVHIPSIMVTPEESPTLRAFLDHVEVVATIHGFGRRPLLTAILLGGRNRALASHVGDHLRQALPEYEVIEDLDRIPVELQGMHHRNPVNLARSGGVQVELPPRARGVGPFWADWDSDGPVPHTASVIAGLAAAASAFQPTPDGEPA